MDHHAADAVVRAMPVLLASRSAALVWRRARSDPAVVARIPADALRNAYRHAALDMAVQGRRIGEVVARLNQAGIEPMLFKGLAVGAAYAEPFSRPGGDIDLILRPEDRDLGAAILGDEVALLRVDLAHDHLVGEADIARLFARRARLRIRSTTVTVPSPEDHLRLLCAHALRHGMARPLWLCDVAAWTEARPPDFDWSIALGPTRASADHLRTALGLAHRLLGMDVEQTPAEAVPVPAWVVGAVLRRWSDVSLAATVPRWRSNRGFAPRARALGDRWPPDPIELAAKANRSFDRPPGLCCQLLSAARRAMAEVRPSSGVPLHG